jgi:class 3 adenylate cyclase
MHNACVTMRGDGRSRRLLRAFLIADVRGYSTFAEVRGPEDSRALAARFVTIATSAVTEGGGEILATEAMANVVHTIDNARFVEREPTPLKGIDRPVRFVQVVAADLDARTELRRMGLERAAAQPKRARRRRVLISAVAAVLLLAVATVDLVTRLSGSGSRQSAPGVVADRPEDWSGCCR